MTFIGAVNDDKIYGSFSYNIKTHECDFADAGQEDKGPRRMYLALGFLTPAIIIIISYIFIFYKAKRSVAKVQILQQNQRSRSTSSFASTESTQKENRPAVGLRTRDIRIAVTILVIFIVFLVCCMPVSVMHYYDDSGKHTTALLLLHPLYWLQYCLNIFIYVFMNKQYRDAYINYISRWWPTFKDFTVERFKWAEDENTTDRVSKALTPNSMHRMAVANSQKKKTQGPKDSPQLNRDESISLSQ